VPMSRFLAVAATTVGYSSVGIKARSMKDLAGNKFCQVKDAYRVRYRVGGEERFLVRREGEVFGIAAAVSFGREVWSKRRRAVWQKVVSSTAISSRLVSATKSRVFAAIEKKSGRVRANRQAVKRVLRSAMKRTTRPVARSSSATDEAFQSETKAALCRRWS